MDWVWQSEELLRGWTLPAGSALVALGLTTLAATAYARWRAGRTGRAPHAGAQVDLRDEARRAPERKAPALDLQRLDRCLSDLESQVENLRLRLESREPSPGATAVATRPAAAAGSGAKLAGRVGSSPEARALKAFVAADR